MPSPSGGENFLKNSSLMGAMRSASKVWKGPKNPSRQKADGSTRLVDIG